MKKQTPKIVITGAPGSGKTELINHLRQMKEFENVVFFPEIARELLKSRPEYRNNWLEFHREIYKRHIERESKIGNRPFISDRGTIDAFAFCSTSMQDSNTTIESEYDRYTAVLLLGSSALLGDMYYKKDEERLESAEEAIEIEQKLKNTWSGHPYYCYIQAYKDIETKFREAITFLRQMLGKHKIDSTKCNTTR